MASGGVPREPIQVEDDEVKGSEAKIKRRFRPLDAMRKLFSKTRRKPKEEQVSVVAVKAKSTTALHQEDDDDGGFKNRQLGQLGGNRSISEDSVFSPEQKEVSNLQKLKKSAVSEERLPITKSLQAELFSKVRNRRSQYSDDDDGLPHSPTPPVTTADIIMGGPLKPLPGGGKSTSRDSDNSLISVDASDNEEDPFQNKWKRAVPSKSSASPGTSTGAEDHIDLNSIEQTVLLKSNIARDRISVAPKRKSRKKRDAHSPHSLPSLNEESPTKSAPGHISSSSDSLVPEDISLPDVRASPSDTHVVTMKDKPGLPDRGKPSMTLSLADLRPAVAERPKSSTAAVPSGSPIHTPVRPSSAEPVLEDSGKHSIVVPDTSKDGKFLDAKRPEAIIEGSKGASSAAAMNLDVAKGDFSNLAPGNSLLMSSWHAATPASQPIEAPVTEAETFNIKLKSEITTSTSKLAVSQGSESQTDLTEGEGSALTRIAIINTSANTSSTTAKTFNAHTVHSPAAPSSPPEMADRPLEEKKDGLRPTEGTGGFAFSPKDDYKLRRQHRSKTLPEPVAKEEQFVSKVQRTASHRAETNSSQNASPDSSPRLGPTKASEPAKSTEPAWFELARKKTGRQDSKEHKESLKSLINELPTSTVAASFNEVAITPVTEIQSTASSSSRTETPAPSALNSPESISLSSAFNKFESKTSEAFRLRGGSVKTSPTKSNPLSARGGSVKITPAKVEHVSGMLSAGTTQFFNRGPNASPSTTLVVTSPPPIHSASKVDEVKESKVAETPSAKDSTFKDLPIKEAQVKESPAKEAQAKETQAKEASAKEVPKWKAPVFKTPQSFSASPQAAPWSQPATRFGTGRVSTAEPQPAPPAATPTLAPKAQLSPAKKMPLAKTLSEEKEKSLGMIATSVGTSSGSSSSIPAWRANIAQKKPVGPDTGGLKIELIESTTNQAVKKPELAKPTESPLKSTTSSGKELPQEQCRSLPPNPRTSKVMNLLKNFENVQGVS